jgi:hypothetical protein
MSVPDFVIVKAHPQMLAFVDHLQRINAEALSFYPLSAFEREMTRGRILLGLLNGQPCGYIYAGAQRDGVMRVHQVCIEYEARRRLYGAGLVAEMEGYAQEIGATAVRLRCGFDLDANSFWSSLGYSCVKVEDGGVRRMRKINVWMRLIGKELFDLVSVDPAVGKTDATVWRKHKQTGIVTQFARGKHMKQYRSLLLSDEDDKA